MYTWKSKHIIWRFHKRNCCPNIFIGFPRWHIDGGCTHLNCKYCHVGRIVSICCDAILQWGRYLYARGACGGISIVGSRRKNVLYTTFEGESFANSLAPIDSSSMRYHADGMHVLYLFYIPIGARDLAAGKDMSQGPIAWKFDAARRQNSRDWFWHVFANTIHLQWQTFNSAAYSMRQTATFSSRVSQRSSLRWSRRWYLGRYGIIVVYFIDWVLHV